MCEVVISDIGILGILIDVILIMSLDLLFILFWEKMSIEYFFRDSVFFYIIFGIFMLYFFLILFFVLVFF